MGKVIIALVILLVILHQDFWLWDSRELIFGFMPAGLAYHVLYSIVCGLVWLLTVIFAWPEQIEKMAEFPPAGDSKGTRRP